MTFISYMPSRRWVCALLCAAAMLPGLASAQVPAAIEGRIISITEDGFGGATVNVMGADVVVPAAVFSGGLATSPTATITSPSQLATGSLPGRAEPGFIGGTAIINGSSSLLGGFVADDLFVEPAENVVIGVITSVANSDGMFSCEMSLEGVPLVFSDDSRMPAGTAINGTGFDIYPCSAIPGDSAAVEGYFGELDGSLHIFAFESDDADIISTASGTTTITRASCDRGRLEVRGSSTLFAGQAVVFDDDDNIQLGSTALQLDPVTNTGSYRFRANVGGCPLNVRVESWEDGAATASSFAVAPVDVR
ncbi:MAG: hypothetical protein OEX13_09435 [Gammaproteobacteria bacterium]|nr:hypothetical protein [Gammaproteobacteria bacterium]MDH5308689.1 hypothetical protein [Gammaproteobacteria bacterium]